jgi:predicted SAM-dependent methyltransferase
MKLNYGCGETKLKDFINIDVEESVKPDLVLDLKVHPFPYEAETVDLIHCIHNIEHIEQRYWPQIFCEFWRVLKPEGELRLAYPEFEKVAFNFLENTRGQRDFWRATLYGRQLYPGDYHVVPMVTAEVEEYLTSCGFHNIGSAPEPFREYNTFLIANKGPAPMTRENLLVKEIFLQK